ncbi:hypothetical protein [Leucobacter sp. GX0328]
MIDFDSNGRRSSVVITCTECPFWSAIRLDRDEAHECAVNHEKVYHPESRQARDAARKYRQRHRAAL